MCRFAPHDLLTGSGQHDLRTGNEAPVGLSLQQGQNPLLGCGEACISETGGGAEELGYCRAGGLATTDLWCGNTHNG